MDFPYYNGQQQTFHEQQQFAGYPSTSPEFVQGISAPQPQGAYQSGYQQFNSPYPFQSNGSFVQHHPQPQQQPSPPHHNDSSESMHIVETTQSSTNGANKNEYSIEIQEQDGNSSAEEKEPHTPAQSRRKAQNRAAQRAFRERKEKHVKDLENKLSALSAHSNSLLSDNEKLKSQLQRLATQNEILRATSSHPSSVVRSPSPVHGPQVYSPIDFQAAVGSGRYPVSFEDFGGPTGSRLLAVGAAWDIIINHHDFKQGRIDMASIQKNLAGKAICSGRGPAFHEQDLVRAIQDSMVADDGLL